MVGRLKEITWAVRKSYRPCTRMKLSTTKLEEKTITWKLNCSSVIVENIRQVCMLDLKADFKTSKQTQNCQLRESKTVIQSWLYTVWPWLKNFVEFGRIFSSILWLWGWGPGISRLRDIIIWTIDSGNRIFGYFFKENGSRIFKCINEIFNERTRKYYYYNFLNI